MAFFVHDRVLEEQKALARVPLRRIEPPPAPAAPAAATASHGAETPAAS
jgi:hypothetical protein